MLENSLHIRPNYIDYAKVIGMFLVIFAHYYYWSGIKSEPSYMLYSVHIIQLFHMPLFFIISGFLYNGISSYREELMKIWKKLFIPYFFICGLTTIIGFSYLYCIAQYSHHKLLYNLLGIITGFDYPNRRVMDFCGPMWFVYALIIIRLLYMAIRRYHYILYLTILLGLILMYIGDCLPCRIDSSMVGFLFFSIGHYFRRWISSLLSVKCWEKGLIVFVCILILTFVGFLSDDFTIRQPFSINILYFGKYPLLFLFSGVAGTIIILLLGNAFTYIHTYIQRADYLSCKLYLQV